MAKILTDEEMGQIIWDATHDTKGRIINEQGPYCRFLKDLATLICDHFGGTPGAVGLPDHDLGYTVGFHVNDCVPCDGGVFKDYDKDVTWQDGVETQV
jgi:hypothetical protein